MSFTFYVPIDFIFYLTVFFSCVNQCTLRTIYIIIIITLSHSPSINTVHQLIYCMHRAYKDGTYDTNPFSPTLWFLSWSVTDWHINKQTTNITWHCISHCHVYYLSAMLQWRKNDVIVITYCKQCTSVGEIFESIVRYISTASNHQRAQIHGTLTTYSHTHRPLTTDHWSALTTDHISTSTWRPTHTHRLLTQQTNKQILSSRLQVTNMDRTERINAHNTWFQVQMCLLGVSTMINYF